ncbi:leucyl/phenylalanyl-tRNA--protein transferase [Aquicoccus sp. G2-2]|uniref:leucyl/phenylalanyl-tRNA--protein transferase n=1 Tax=Aquicoccus sp. G2-2 TaxID=3092120 RepID=UPI002AE04CAC|nr:leucyl/phenylalanyl-tRNA--protein transferase [Aquicoccus sp. G2-2]MEA1113256.1 leucyl/phenylalanyl-tRNA--protein transferase [Aquicoccus sp. G2-2]
MTLKITADLMLHAYTNGIFPMAESHDDTELLWFNPRRRGIFPLDQFHISRSLARQMRNGGYHIAINEDFNETVATCATREETWINPTLTALYAELNQRGIAHSFEVRGPDGLWGGVFGIALGAAFFGESMVSCRTGGSKIALAHLTDHLRRAGFTLFDTQYITPHLATLGAVEISRAAYLARLAEALEAPAHFLETPVCSDGHSIIQRNTQTS